MKTASGYINVHTHRPEQGDHLRLYNHIVKEENQVLPQGPFSAGIHPWYIHQPEIQKILLEKILQHDQCMAVGECGLDHDCRTPFDLQEQVFAHQCRLSVEHNKPVILHAVRAHFSMIKILVETGVKKAIFHGYNNKYTILEKILENGYCVSMGAALANQKSQAAALVAEVPARQLFLETDESELSIENIYALAAEKRGISVTAMQQQITENFNQLFV